MDSSKMSSSSTEKNPTKKRRIDDSKEAVPGPSSDVLPLVAPQLIRKSSKDPNRGMYPRGRDKSNHDHASCPQFIKASELYKRSVLKSKEPKSKMIDTKTNISVHINAQESTSSDTQSTDSKADKDFVENRKKFNYVTKGKRTKTGFHRANAAAKITNYFKSSPVKHSKDNLMVSRDPMTSSCINRDEEFALRVSSTERFFETFSKSYGLLQDSVKEGDGVNYFHKLPIHIIETILCQIPILDLMACRLVCSRWKEIIDREIYMKWKKLYYKYKMECPSDDKNMSARDYLQFFIESLEHTGVKGCIDTLVKYMGRDFKPRPSPDMHYLLMKNPKGKLADEVLSERFPEWSGKESRVWCQLTIAILISETVWDVLGIYLSLFVSNSSCSLPDVINAMYCIATFLLYFRNVNHTNYGYHYRLYYALYLIENYIPKKQREKLKIVRGLPGQQSIYNYRNNENASAYLTIEQIRILNHRFELNQKIRIIALAGTGKTTTLLHLARMYPQMKFLNLVFNKALSDEAKKRFPPNVTCQTAHSLAYSDIGKFLRHKLTSKVRPYELIPHLTKSSGNMYGYANLVLVTINSFVISTDSELNINHVPPESSIDRPEDVSRELIWKDACLIWEKMINKDDVGMKISHDAYLKLYHLKKPKLYKYQCIMVDEAQDCNPAMLDIVLSQNIPVVLVGDPYQQIYGFRGAKNALQGIKSTHTYYLTKSFRFGPEIAYIASCILEFLIKPARKNTIVGNTHNSYINGVTVGQYAVIARTNMKLFNEALRIVVFKDFKLSEPRTINAAFAGGIKSYGFDQLIDICKLSGSCSIKDTAITDKFVSKFKSFDDLYTYARNAEDADLMTKIDLVNQHGSNIVKFVSVLKEKCSHPIQLANIVFSTAHKAKGLEFDTVFLTDDFCVNFENIERFIEEDVNILYVAITRAKRSVILPEKITKTLLAAHEKFEYPVSSKIALKYKTELKCAHCGVLFTPHTVLLMRRQRVVLASGRDIPEGPFCTKCGSDPLMRPDVHVNHVIMYLDPTRDNTHQFMNKITGALPTEPPIIYDNFAQFQNHDRIFVINVNIH